MKILIFGSEGQLGCELVRQARYYTATIQAPTLAQMDISAISQVQELITRFRPTLVINAAAYTNVDGAETETEAAFAANSSGPANLAQCCCKDHIPLIHVSTDFVFDGEKGQPYTEDDPIGPLGVYGRSKAEGEEKIRAIVDEHIIVRTSWLYGVYGHNFVRTMLNLARDNKEIRVVNDQYGSPTSAADLAAALLQIADRIAKRSAIPWGTYHYSGQGITTWYEFAENILKMAAAKASMRTPCVEPITTDEYPNKAMRPAFSALDCRRIAKRFGIHPKPWKQSLEATINRIFSDSDPDEHECDEN
jgi:dTDP-4-dehydrorhamnose reductase